MGYVIEYDYDYKSSENYDYNYDYDYLKKCNRLQSNTIAITITPALYHTQGTYMFKPYVCSILGWSDVNTCISPFTFFKEASVAVCAEFLTM